MAKNKNNNQNQNNNQNENVQNNVEFAEDNAEVVNKKSAKRKISEKNQQLY